MAKLYLTRDADGTRNVWRGKPYWRSLAHRFHGGTSERPRARIVVVPFGLAGVKLPIVKPGECVKVTLTAAECNEENGATP